MSAMLRGYANGGTNASGSYIGALAEVLSHYPRMIALRAGDLVTGVPRDTRFLPTPADVITWCERELEEWRTIVDREDRERALLDEAKQRAEKDAALAVDRAVRPTLQKMQDQYGPNWGIGAGDSIGVEAKAKQTALFERANRITLERSRQAAGANPNSVASPELVRLMEEKRAMRQPFNEAAE